MTVGDNGALDLNGFDNEINTLTGTGTVENSAAGTTATLGVGVNNTPGLGDKNTEFYGVFQDGPGTGNSRWPSWATTRSPSAAQQHLHRPDDGRGRATWTVTGSIANSPVDLAGGELADRTGMGP